METNELMDKFQNDLNKKGGFKRTDTPKNEKQACSSTEHLPPTHIVLPAGRYEYTCPECGNVTIVNSQKSIL